MLGRKEAQSPQEIYDELLDGVKKHPQRVLAVDFGDAFDYMVEPIEDLQKLGEAVLDLVNLSSETDKRN